jgi:UDP-GlcNAc:undecaprenyl-phosphate/decaprenyl-phosphate GlcNAc-1-phosphate transferase
MRLLEATLIPGATTAVVALLATPLATVLARRTGALAHPSERGLHENPTPYFGGLAMLVAVAVAALLFLGGDAEVRAIVAGGFAAVAVGVLDDALDLHPALKLIGQVAAAAIPVALGVRVEELTLPLVGTIEFGALSGPLTVFGIVAVMNVVNFSDGIDGLAAGVCAIAAITFCVIAASYGRYNAAALAAITAGAALGFLRYNFPPASIFMGDGGSNLLGYLLSCCAVLGFLKTTAIFALLLPLVILAAPILDTGFAVARRIRGGLPFYRPDSEHIHHRMARIGLSRRRAVLYLYAWTGVLAAFAIAIRFADLRDEDGAIQPLWLAVLLLFALVAIAATAYVVYMLEIFQFSQLRRFQLRRTAADRGAPPPTDPELEAQIERELATGEFEAAGE